MHVPFANRAEAGRLLATQLRKHKRQRSLAVLALPRGGVPVAFEVAVALAAPLDLLLVRKLGFPGQRELAIGAIATGGVQVLDEDLISAAGISSEVIERIAAAEQDTMKQRESLYRAGRPTLDIARRSVILVDDGVATGATMSAALKAARKRGADKVIVAAPVMSISSWEYLSSQADEVVCLAVPERFHAVGEWYEDFSQVEDQDVQHLLDASQRREVA